MTITSTLDKLRLTIGDTDSTAPLFQDDELNYFLDTRSDNILLAAADACDAAAARFARAYDFSVDGQSFSRSSMVAAYRGMAAEFRNRANGLSTVVETKVDGYSQTIDSDQVAGTDEQNPRQIYTVIHGLDRLP